MIVLLFGESNSGKSTLGKRVAEEMDMIYISSGDIAREITSAEILNSGQLAPEDNMRNAILRKINDADKDIILDGFPRFYDQYEWMMQTIADSILPIAIICPFETILKRAKLRGRDDDESIMKKHEFFMQETEPMVNEIDMYHGVYMIHNDDCDDIESNVAEIKKMIEDERCYQ